MLRFCSYPLCLPPDHAAFQADDEGSIPFTRSSVCLRRSRGEPSCPRFTRLYDAGTQPKHSYLTAWHGGLAATVHLPEV